MKKKIFDYVYFITWLIRDSVTSFKFTIIGYVSFNLGSTLAQVAALGLAVKYIGGLSAGGVTRFSKFGISFNLDANAPYLIGGLLLLSSIGLFAASRLVTRTMRLYEEKCVYSVLDIFLNRSFFGRPAHAEHLTEADLVKAVTRDARVSGRALSTIWTMIVPTIMVIGSGIFILYLNVLLSITLFLIAGFFIYFYVWTGKSAANLSEDIQTYARGDSRNRALYIKYLNSIGVDIDLVAERSQKLLSLDESKKFLDSYEKRLRVVHYGLLTGNILLALIVFVVMSFFTYRVQHGENIWSYTLFYFLGLNYCFGNLRTIGKSLTTLNIFFPFFSRYIAFVTQKEIGNQTLSKTEKIKLKTDQTEVFWKKGDLLFCFSDLEVNKVNLNSILESLLGSSFKTLLNKEFRAQFATGMWSLWGEDVQENINVFKKSSKAISEVWPFSRLEELESEVLSRSKDEDFSINIWNRKIDRGYKFIVSLLPILSRPGELVLLDGHAFFTLPEEEQQWICEKLKSSYFVVINAPEGHFSGEKSLQIEKGQLTYSSVHQNSKVSTSGGSLEDESLLDLELEMDS